MVGEYRQVDEIGAQPLAGTVVECAPLAPQGQEHRTFDASAHGEHRQFAP
ncbi:hypothetical protein [Streptomyces sp. NPDC020480]